MMGKRTADERAAFVLRFLPEVTRMVDVGCGPGTITVGLAQTTAPGVEVSGFDRELSQVEMAREAARAAGVTNVQFQQGSAYELPLADHSVDLVFAHAVLEHLASPRRALAEFGRVLREGGVVAVASSDWSAARLDPWNDDVDRALRGHYLLRNQAGGDPFMGRRLRNAVLDAGFVDVHTRCHERVDMAYHQLARYVGSRIESAISGASDDYQDELRRAAAAARRWAAQRGSFSQCWVEVTARSQVRTTRGPMPGGPR